MVTKTITSLQHPVVKHLVQLRLDRSYREETQRVLLSGEKIIRELPIHTLYSLKLVPDIQCRETYLVSEPILKKITGLSQPDGFAAEITLPPPQDLSKKEFVLVLDELADPGNLGTLIRTALALRWDGVVLTSGTVDLFNDKALRAAKGATFHLPYARLSREELRGWKRNFYIADLEGEEISKASFKAPLALVLSNEARGAGIWPVSQKITIPTNQKVESLNVAASGAILLYAMRTL